MDGVQWSASRVWDGNAQTDGSGLTNYPRSPSSSGTCGLNPWTFFKPGHLFGASLANQSADLCLGLNAMAQNTQGCKVSDCGEDYQSGTEDTRDPGVTRCRWTVFGLLAARMFGISICRLVQPHLTAELLILKALHLCQAHWVIIQRRLLSYCDWMEVSICSCE